MDKEIKKPTICLVMIVKNESKVIERCLNSVKNYIDYWVIVDTGSNDGTQKMVIDLMDNFGIKGELYERSWKDFGTNRTESLNLSKGKCDYRLIIDADDVLEVEEGKNPFLNLDKDSYKIKIKLNPISYFRTQIVRGDQEWRYVGVLHEYITGPRGVKYTDGFIEGAFMVASVSGHNREIKGPKKYYSDALIFEKALITLSEDDIKDGLKERYTFYLAQSYRDAGMTERSIEFYQKRVELGGWEEEVYVSKYWIAKQKQNLNKSDSEIIDSYMDAWEYRPSRLEALYYLIKFLGSRKRYSFAFALATVAMKTQKCSDILFVENDIWKWRMPDEYSVLAFYNGNPKEASFVTRSLIESPTFEAIPELDRNRILKNMEYYSSSIEEVKEMC
jgi:glycosyltransferase involved in cell wall biosynthesis